MTPIVQILWLVPAVPIVAAASIALMKQRQRVLACSVAIAAISASMLLSIAAFVHVLSLRAHSLAVAEYVNFPWLTVGNQPVLLGWLLDPLSAVMLAMVTVIALLVFVFSLGYMKHDENVTRFYCFLSLFCGAMLGLILANSLLLLFMCWEVVGLTSYLLIGFWYNKPSAAAAAKKAFLVTRIGDLGLFTGMAWLASQAGTLVFYNNGAGFLEQDALAHLAAHATPLGVSAATAIGLLLFCGAIGKSGQFPLHVWLPDAMQGPTPVSALIHAATMVAAGVFLVARTFPLLAANAGRPISTVFVTHAPVPTFALETVAWIGAITALFGACVAVAQFDIKRVLAYSTVSQLGYMMLGLATGGVSVGIFHLVAHAFFKALLFLGAGSIIHGCHHEQDIRRMGGLRTLMPVTFLTYMVGMLALCGFPLVFSGFWSKDAILHAASGWSVSHVPFYMATIAALLTAFYMTRQACYIFANKYRSDVTDRAMPHESPATMTTPLVMLAAFTLLIGIFGTPMWPWFQSLLTNTAAPASLAALGEDGLLRILALSSLMVFIGLGLGWIVYRKPRAHDPLQQRTAGGFGLLQSGFFVDQVYSATFVPAQAGFAIGSAWLDMWVWGGAVSVVRIFAHFLAQIEDAADTKLVNGGFNEACARTDNGGRLLATMQSGELQRYLRLAGVAMLAGLWLLLWGVR